MSDYAITLQQPHPELVMEGVQRWVTLPDLLPDGVTRLAIHAGPAEPPVTAAVGTVDVVRCLPIVEGADEDGIWGEGTQFEPLVGVDHDGRILHWEPDTRWNGPGWSSYGKDISDQLPFADWSPGRWAVEVANPVRALEGEA